LKQKLKAFLDNETEFLSEIIVLTAGLLLVDMCVRAVLDLGNQVS
jgi:hypothetical protein